MMVHLRRILATCVLGAGIWLLPHVAYADVPHLIRYQGQAVDSQGVPLEGPYTLTFRLYDAETGGTKVWEEIQANVVLQGGHFSVLLGQVTPLTAMDWSRPCWLSVQVGTESELAPRQRITSVPMAIMAEQLEGPIHTSGSSVGIGTDTPAVGARLDVNGKIYEYGSALVPRGVIVIWSGSRSAIPSGWALCDGRTYTAPNGDQVTTPDLRDRFVLGAAAGEDPGVMGGSQSHAHGGTTSTNGGHYHATSRGVGGGAWVESAGYGTTWSGAQTEISQGFDGVYNNGPSGYDAFNTSTAGSHSHSVSTDSSSHLPPYYKVAFVMKL